MRNKFICTLALIAMLLMSAPLMAQDSGVYFTPEVNGQGLNLTRNGDVTQFFFYTYEPNDGCWNIEIPELGVVTHDNCHEQRYFMSSGDLLEDDTVIEGWLYITVGLDFPFGVPSPSDPFISDVGEPLAVGTYRMTRFGGGWRLSVVRFGEVLPADDPIFMAPVDFTVQLLPATD